VPESPLKQGVQISVTVGYKEAFCKVQWKHCHGLYSESIIT